MSKDIDKEILVEKVREFERRTGHTVDSFPTTRKTQPRS